MALSDTLKTLWQGSDPSTVKADGIRYRVTVAVAAGETNPVTIQLSATTNLPSGATSTGCIVSALDVGDVVDVVQNITIVDATTITCTRVNNDRVISAGDWFHIGVNSVFIQSIRDTLEEVDIRTALP